MIFVDTHTHLYLEHFQDDIDEVMQRAFSENVKYLLLPNVDSQSIEPMLDLCDRYPKNCFSMIGLHPTSVKGDYRKELEIVKKHLEKNHFIAVGETGIDLYWDETTFKEQEISFRIHLEIAKEFELPIVIHSRNSFEEIYDIISEPNYKGIDGVFHCFCGSLEQANRVIGLGYKLGIGGVLTFKNAGLNNVVKNISLEHIVLETDSPYLAPTPFRGKRNESSYIVQIAEKLADIKNVSLEKVAEITTKNAEELFSLKINK